MSRRKKKAVNPEHVLRELRSEIRRILRKHATLTQPFSLFREVTDRAQGTPRFLVCFDTRPRVVSGEGLKARMTSLVQPDERLEDEVFDFARAVWHLRERISQFARANVQPVDLDLHLPGNRDLLIAGDLINRKKHGANDNESKCDPHLGLPALDTSDNGVVEYWADGAMKEFNLLVSEPKPIGFTIDVHHGDGSGVRPESIDTDSSTLIGNAPDIIFDGFKHWAKLIGRLGVLTSKDRESLVLSALLDNVVPGWRT